MERTVAMQALKSFACTALSLLLVFSLCWVAPTAFAYEEDTSASNEAPATVSDAGKAVVGQAAGEGAEPSEVAEAIAPGGAANAGGAPGAESEVPEVGSGDSKGDAVEKPSQSLDAADDERAQDGEMPSDSDVMDEYASSQNESEESGSSEDAAEPMADDQPDSESEVASAPNARAKAPAKAPSTYKFSVTRSNTETQHATLGEAIKKANGYNASTAVVTITMLDDYTVTKDDLVEFNKDHPVIFDGGEGKHTLTVDSTVDNYVFRWANGSVRDARGLTIMRVGFDGAGSSSASGFLQASKSSVTLQDCTINAGSLEGDLISSSVDLTINNSTLTGNSAPTGSVIKMTADNKKLAMDAVTVSGHACSQEGVCAVDASAITTASYVTIQGSMSITGNTAAGKPANLKVGRTSVLKVAASLTGENVGITNVDSSDVDQQFGTATTGIEGVDKLVNDVRDKTDSGDDIVAALESGKLYWRDWRHGGVCRVVYDAGGGVVSEYYNTLAEAVTRTNNADLDKIDVAIEILTETVNSTAVLAINPGKEQDSHRVTLATAKELLDTGITSTIYKDHNGDQIFSVHYADLECHDITFDGNASSHYGNLGAFAKQFSGGHYISLGNGATLTNFRATGHGGVVDLDGNDTGFIMAPGSKITKCYAAGSGGGAVNVHHDNTGTYITMNGAEISDCYAAAGSGGAINLEDSTALRNSVVTITNCKFSNCHAVEKGGAINVGTQGATVTISESTFVNCYTTKPGTNANRARGGAIHLNSKANLEATDSVFDGCNTIGKDKDGVVNDANSGRYSDGGALYLNGGGTVSIASTSIKNCEARLSGGGAYVASSGTVALNDVTVSKCAATNGGALSVGTDGQLELTGSSHITENTALQNGSAVFMDGASGTIAIKDSVRIEDNTASTAGSTYSGGALYNSGAKIEVSGAPYIRNNKNEKYADGTQAERNMFLVNTTTTNAGAVTYSDRLTVVGDLTGGEIGVYCEDTNPANGKNSKTIRYNYKDQFGSVPSERVAAYNVLGLQHLTNDRTSEADNLHGNPAATKRLVGIAGEGTQVVWGWVCQIIQGGAFKEVYGSLKEAVDDTNDKYTGTSTIEMLIPEYLMERSAAFNTPGNDVTITTASTTEQHDGYAFQKFDRNTEIATVVKGADESMLTSSIKKLAFTNVVFDGHSEIVHENSSGEQVRTGSSDGGIVKLAAGSLELGSGAVFRNSTVGGGTSGGAIAAAAETSVTLANGSTVVNCKALNGGAVYGSGAEVTVASGAVVAANTASSGGGLYLDGGSLHAKGAAIGGTPSYSGNQAQQDGGGLYLKNLSTAELDGATIGSETAGKGNSASGNGGGIFVTGSKGLTLPEGTKVWNNTAANGGNVYSDNAPLTVQATVKNGTASGNGGSLYATGSEAVVTLSGTSASLESSTAHNGGGVYAAQGARVSLGSGARISACGTYDGTATVNGGGAYLASGASLTLQDTAALFNNVATTAGGGAYLDGGTLRVSTNDGANYGVYGNYTSGDASQGGGVYVAGSGAALELTGLGSIHNNGYYSAGGTPSVRTSQGGGVYVAGGTVSLAGTATVKENKATTGGGLYVAGGSASVGTGAAVSGNAAATDGQGGGAYASGGTLTLDGAAVSGNAANQGAGVYIASGGVVQMQGASAEAASSLASNTVTGSSPHGAGAYLASGGKLKLQGNVVVAGNAGDIDLSGTAGANTYKNGVGELYLASGAGTAQELEVTGNLSDSSKILVWAADASHDGTGASQGAAMTADEQFGITTSSSAAGVAGLSRFVSQRAYENESDKIVTGKAGSGSNVVWSGTVFLKITNKIEGAYADKTKTFSFQIPAPTNMAEYKVYTSLADAQSRSNPVVVNQGAWSDTLGDGAVRYIEVPSGWEFSVVELTQDYQCEVAIADDSASLFGKRELDNDNRRASVAVAGGTPDAPASITFTNTMPDVLATGILGDSSPWTLLALGAGAVLLFYGSFRLSRARRRWQAAPAGRSRQASPSGRARQGVSAGHGSARHAQGARSAQAGQSRFASTRPARSAQPAGVRPAGSIGAHGRPSRRASGSHRSAGHASRPARRSNRSRGAHARM